MTLENNQVTALTAELETARKERDEAKSLLQFACRDWAEDDTAIKEIAARHGITCDDGGGYFIDRLQVMQEMEKLLLATNARVEKAWKDARQDAFGSCHMPEDTTEELHAAWLASPTYAALKAKGEAP